MKNVTDKADATAIMGKDKAFHQESKLRKCAKQRKKKKILIGNTEGKADVQITSEKSFDYSRQHSCQAVVKAGSPEPGIDTNCKRLKNSGRWKWMKSHQKADTNWQHQFDDTEGAVQ